MRQRVLDARRGPMGESTDVVFALSPSHQFRIEKSNDVVSKVSAPRGAPCFSSIHFELFPTSASA